MSKLELKHLAPYLPYRLNLKWKNKLYDLTIMMDGLDEFGIQHTNIGYSGAPLYYTPFDREDVTMKPILRPLSDLTKEITYNKEKFVPIIKMVKGIVEGVGKTKFKPFNASDGHGIIYAVSNEMWQLQYKTYDNCFRLHDFSLGAGKTKGSKATEHYPNQLELFNKLFEWHFDVFGLIEQGLAIDINTIK